jgi:hypothetical protein
VATIISGHDGVERKLGWKRSSKMRAQPHFAGGYGLTPQQKGFPILPESNLSPFIKRTRDQGPLGSCTGNAWAGAIEASRLAAGLHDREVSALAIYAAERDQEHVPLSEDSGAYIHDGGIACASRGVPAEALWPYDVSKYAQEPPKQVWDDASGHKLTWYTLSTLDWVLAALSFGRPVVFGFDVIPAFGTETARTGYLPLPQPGDDLSEGHAVYAYAHSIVTDELICHNSWGPSFASGLAIVLAGKSIVSGSFRMPMDYVRRHLASDFCTPHWEAA